MLIGLVKLGLGDGVHQRRYCLYVRWNERKDERSLSPLSRTRLFLKLVLILSIARKD